MVNESVEVRKQFENAREAIEYLENSNIHNFWIINKKLKEVYGPMQKREYAERRKELKIPKELGLKEE